MSTDAPAPLRLGTRGSRLALRQADLVTAKLTSAWPGLSVERVVLSTAGDRIPDTALSRIGDKGLFTRELEDALREGRIDLAVHSLKDLPTAMPDGLALGAVTEREDPRDALCSASGASLRGLPRGARLGTSSLRRRAQALAARPDLQIVELRGNVPTRLSKLEAGLCDAVILAHAGLLRLGLEGRVSELLDPSLMLPAVGQGALGVQIRAGDDRVAPIVAPLDHRPTRLSTAAERALLARLEGGCQVPVGALGSWAGERLTLRALVADLDGSGVVRGELLERVTSEDEARRLGDLLARHLLAEGADAVLDRARATSLGADKRVDA